MKQYIHFAALLLLLLLGAVAPEALGGVFVTEAQSFSGNSSAAAERAFFREHLGSSSPKQWALNQPGTISKTKFFGSEIWQNISDASQQSFTGNLHSQPTTLLQFKFEKAITINNKASSRSLDVLGNLGEDIMDDFYRKDGWEAIDGKRGRQGIDGLYVKRDKNGRIKDFIIADAKTGSSKLRDTRHGRQLDKRWCRHNLKELLKTARQAKPADPQRIADLEQLVSLHKQDKGRKPRVFSVKFENGVCVIKHTDAKGNVIGNPYKVDMRGNGRQQKRIYKSIEKNIARHNPKSAAKITAKIRDGFAKGKCQNNSDLYRAVKREIPDRKLANQVVREMKKEGLSKQAAREKGKMVASRRSGFKSGASQAGLALLMGIGQGGLSVESLTGIGKGLAIDAATDAFVEQGARYGSRALASSQLKNAGKKVTQKALSNSVSKLAPTFAKVGGSLVSVAFAGWEVYGFYQQYSSGTMSSEEFWTHTSIAAAGGLGGVAATAAVSSYLATGAALGTVGGPLGTAIGVGVGAVVAGVAAGVDYFYTQHKVAEMQAKIRADRVRLAQEDARRTEEEKKAKIIALDNQIDTAWTKLLAH